MSEVKSNVYFSDGVYTDELQIFEVTEEVLADLVAGNPVVLRGQPEDDSVLCSQTKTYQIRQVENSNTSLLVDMTQYTAKHGDAKPTVENPYIIVGVASKHYELTQINPLTHQIPVRLAEDVVTRAHDRYIMKSLDAEDADMRMRRRLQMTDDTIHEILGESHWSPKKTKRESEKQDRSSSKYLDDEDDAEDDYDDMFEPATTVKSSHSSEAPDSEDASLLGSKRTRSKRATGDTGDGGVTLPRGVTFRDLLNCIQASEDEIQTALTVSDQVLRLPGEYWRPSTSAQELPDRYVLVDPMLQTKVIDAILDIVVARGYDLECIPFMELLRELRRDGVCSVPLIYHGVRALQSVDERSKNQLLVPVPGHLAPRSTSTIRTESKQITDDNFDSGTQILSVAMESSSADELEAELSRVVIVQLDAKQIAIYRAIQLLKTKSPYTAKEFLSDWKFSVPPGVTVVSELLMGIALRTQIVPALDGTQTASGAGKTRVDAFEYFPKSELSATPRERFTQLFTHRAEWTKEEITPYVQDFISKTLSLDQLLLKESRAVRSTTLPPQPDGKPTLVYTWR